MFKRSGLSLLASLLAAGLATIPVMAQDTVTQTAAPSPSSHVEGDQKLFMATGTARIVSNITGTERSIMVSALITADTIEQARAQAKEALSADAALRGRVLQVYVGDVW